MLVKHLEERLHLLLDGLDCLHTFQGKLLAQGTEDVGILQLSTQLVGMFLVGFVMYVSSKALQAIGDIPMLAFIDFAADVVDNPL